VLADEALASAERLFGAQHLTTAQAMMTRGRLMVERGQAEDAEPLLRKCVQLHDRLDLTDEQHWSSAQARGTLGYCLLKQDRFDEAEPLLLGCFEVLQASKGTTYTGTRSAQDRLVSLYEAWGKPDQAARWGAELAMSAPREAE
jgi:hypothetical protein